MGHIGARNGPHWGPTWARRPAMGPTGATPWAQRAHPGAGSPHSPPMGPEGPAVPHQPSPTGGRCGVPRDEHQRRHRPPPDSVHSCFQLEEAAGRKEAPHPNVQNQGSTWCGVDRPTPWWWLKANLGTLTLKNAEAAKSWRPHSPGGVTQFDALNQSPASGFTPSHWRVHSRTAALAHVHGKGLFYKK